jgi:hypothetical protein
VKVLLGSLDGLFWLRVAQRTLSTLLGGREADSLLHALLGEGMQVFMLPSNLLRLALRVRSSGRPAHEFCYKSCATRKHDKVMDDDVARASGFLAQRTQ